VVFPRYCEIREVEGFESSETFFGWFSDSLYPEGRFRTDRNGSDDERDTDAPLPLDVVEFLIRNPGLTTENGLPERVAVDFDLDETDQKLKRELIAASIIAPDKAYNTQLVCSILGATTSLLVRKWALKWEIIKRSLPRGYTVAVEDDAINSILKGLDASRSGTTDAKHVEELRSIVG
jgi:hypothetical protein